MGMMIHKDLFIRWDPKSGGVSLEYQEMLSDEAGGRLQNAEGGEHFNVLHVFVLFIEFIRQCMAKIIILSQSWIFCETK